MRHRVVVLLAALAIASAGCGGAGASGPRSQDGGAAYAAAVNRAEHGLARRFAALEDRLAPTSTPARDRRLLASYEAALRVTAQDLRAVTPPSGLQAVHRRLVAAVEGYGAALRAIRGGLRAADARSVLTAQRRLSAAVAGSQRDIAAAIDAINRKLGG